MDIREAVKEDLEDVVSLEVSSLGPIWEEDDIDYDEDLLKTFLRKAFEKDRMVISERGGEVLAFLHSRTFEDAVTGMVVREILTLTIHPDHFGEGLGGSLVEYERRDAAEKGVDLVKLEVLSSNERAVKFYQKKGFSEKKKVMTLEPKADDNLKEGDLDEDRK